MSTYDTGSLSLLSLSPTAAVTSTGNQTGVDLQNYIGTALVVLDAAAGTGTSPTNTIKLQGSDDNSTWADISGAAFSQLTNAASQQKLNINVDAIPRYIRVVDTVGGTTPSFTRSVNLIGLKQVFP